MKFDSMALALAKAGQAAKDVGATVRRLVVPSEDAAERERRRTQKTIDAIKAAEARDRALMERLEQQGQHQARERSAKAIAKSVREKGWWFPGDRR